MTLAIATTVFLGYWEYSREFHANPSDLELLVQGLGPAPQQYRIGVVQVAALLRTHLHIAMRHSFALFDFFGAAAAVGVLFRLLIDSVEYGAADETLHWVASAAFAALVLFYLPWSLWYIRPETWTTCASMALLLCCLTRGNGPEWAWLRVLATLLIASVQALVRADAVIVAELGVALSCVLRPAAGLALRRSVQAVTSFTAVLIAAGIQFYLERVVYPHASYGSTPVVQLRLNLTEPGRWLPFFVVIVPYVWFLLVQPARSSDAPPSSLEAATRAWLPGSLLYLGTFLV